MTSKNSFWKYSNWNFKKRLWTFALCAVIWFFIFPVSIFIRISNILEQYIKPELLDQSRDWIIYKILNSQIPGEGLYAVLVVAMGVFLALQGFAWNNHQSRVDLYKSVPVKAAKRFWYINLNSLWVFVLSFGVNLLLANIVIGMRGFWDSKFVAASVMSFLMHLLLFLSSYLITLIAQSLTGNVVLGFFGAVFLLTVEPICTFLAESFGGIFYRTYYMIGRETVLEQGVFSPIIPYVGMYKSISRTGLGFADIGNYGAILKWVLLFLAQIIVYGMIAYQLYQKRPAQTGGKNMVFPKTKPVIKCAIMIVGSLVFGLVFAQVNSAVGYGLFGVVCGLLITQVVLQTIMEGNFKEAIRGRISFAVAAVISLAIYFTFALDLTGYDTYLPKEEKVESFAIFRVTDYRYDFFNEKGNYISAENYVMGNMQIKDEKAKQLLLSTLREAIEEDAYCYRDDSEVVTAVATAEAGMPIVAEATNAVYEDGEKMETVNIKLRLTNGREVTRRYYLKLDAIRRCYAYLYELPEYKEGIYIELQDFVTEKIAASDKCYATYQTYGAESGDCQTKSQELVKNLLLAAQSDIRDRSAEELMLQAPIGELRLGNDYETKEFMDFESRNLNIRIPVYESDEAVIALLKEANWYRTPGFREDEVEGVVIHQYSSDAPRGKELKLNPGDPLFAEVIEAFVMDDATTQASDVGAFVKANYRVTMNVNPQDGTSYAYTCTGLLLREKFPEELENVFEEIEEIPETDY